MTAPEPGPLCWGQIRSARVSAAFTWAMRARLLPFALSLPLRFSVLRKLDWCQWWGLVKIAILCLGASLADSLESAREVLVLDGSIRDSVEILPTFGCSLLDGSLASLRLSVL